MMIITYRPTTQNKETKTTYSFKCMYLVSKPPSPSSTPASSLHSHLECFLVVGCMIRHWSQIVETFPQALGQLLGALYFVPEQWHDVMMMMICFPSAKPTLWGLGTWKQFTYMYYIMYLLEIYIKLPKLNVQVQHSPKCEDKSL